MLTKMVDGKEVVMSQEEEADVSALWAANDPAKKSAPAPKLTDGALADLLVSKGVLTQADVTGATAAPTLPDANAVAP